MSIGRFMLLLLLGLLVAVAVMLMPLGPVEQLIGASGVAELVPAAAPPLGPKARALLAFSLAALPLLLGASIGVSGSRPKGRRRPSRAAWAADHSSSASGLFERLRGEEPAPGEAAPPRLRSADRHPDAPARAPIRAGVDLAGVEPLPPPVEPGSQPAPDAGPVPAAAAPLPSAATAVPDSGSPARIARGSARAEESGGNREDGTAAPGDGAPASRPSAPPVAAGEAMPAGLHGLADRLEAALEKHGAAARARLLSRRPAHRPAAAPPVSETLDEALEQAIRSMESDPPR